MRSSANLLGCVFTLQRVKSSVHYKLKNGPTTLCAWAYLFFYKKVVLPIEVNDDDN